MTACICISCWTINFGADKNNEPVDVEALGASSSSDSPPEQKKSSLPAAKDEPSSANKSMKDEMEDTLVGTTVVGAMTCNSV